MSLLIEVHLTFNIFVGAQCHKSGHLISHPEVVQNLIYYLFVWNHKLLTIFVLLLFVLKK